MKLRFAVLLMLVGVSVVQAQVKDISGSWRFQLDREDAGVTQSWFNQSLPETIQLPGVLSAQGFGDPVSMDTPWTGNIRDLWFKDPYYKQYQDPENFKMPFWLQPDRHYVGAAWYQRDIVIPEDWQGKRVVLFLERPHWETTVWLDGQRIGCRRFLSTPHEHVLGVALKPGKHRLTIRVDNRMVVNVGPNSHSVSDHTQGNWNGIVGRIELRATDPVWIDDLQIYPDIAARSTRLELVLGNAMNHASPALKLKLRFNDRENGVGLPHVTDFETVLKPERSRGGRYCYTFATDALLWDEFQPALNRVEVAIAVELNGKIYRDRRTVTFGLTEFGTQGTQITVNGRPTYLRGTLECCIFPLTSHPPMDVPSWKRIVRICKDHGLNHMRFHSWCPPEAAFVAADDLGFYLQVECSSWANQGTTVGDGRPVDGWLYEEAAAIIKAYGNHPSFMMMAYGNEPGGKHQKEYLASFVKHWQQRDPRRLYTTGAGWPVLPESDFHSSPNPRIQRWGEGIKSLINGQAPRSDYDWSDFVKQHNDAPTVSHEIGQWCAYPNLDERAKYTGLLKAKNFDIFAEQLERNGMRHQARDFLLASGKLQTLCYKADIEAALRTPGFGGFQLLDLHDFPGQGTALVGVLDPFWDEKGYVTAEAYRQFSGPIVPLARFTRFIYEVGDTLHVPMQLAQYGPQALQGVQPAWTLRDAPGTIVKSGVFARQDITSGTLADIGEVRTSLDGFAKATKLTLEVVLPETEVVNHWDLWVYPRETKVESADVLVTRVLDAAVQQRLQQGGKVLWLPPAGTIKDDPQHPIQMSFSSIFWNTVWTDWQPPHTLGILCDPQHAALAEFPTEFHSNWQWWDLMHEGQPFLLTEYEALTPIVQVIDDWVTARKLALVFEARVGRGKLLACSCDLVTDLDQRPVARQMRASLLQYMGTKAFAPTTPINVAQLKKLCREPSLLESLGAQVRADSSHPNYGPELAIDGNPATIWHTPWQPATAFPHYLILDLQSVQSVTGFHYLPRADGPNGRIADYALYLSLDGRQWGEPVSSGTWDNSPSRKTIPFTQAQQARYVKLEAGSEVKGQVYASAAEIDIDIE